MNKLDLWIRDDQQDRWEKQANDFKISIYEYIRRATDAYTNLINQDNGNRYKKNMYLSKNK